MNSKTEAPRDLGELLSMAYDRFWRDGRSAHTYRTYVVHLTQAMGALKLPEVTAAAIDRWATGVRRDGSLPATVNRKLQSLRRSLSWAQEMGWASSVPQVSLYHERRGRMRWATADEVARMSEAIRALPTRGVGALDADAYADLVELLAETGMRTGEAMRLLWRDIDLGLANMLTVWETKGDIPRSVPLTARAAAVFRRRATSFAELPVHKQRGVAVEGPFRGLTQAALNRAWNKGKRAMGLERDRDFVPHSLRHGFASRLVKKGVPLAAVQRLLGHSSIRTTMIYAHLSTDDLRAAVGAL